MIDNNAIIQCCIASSKTGPFIWITSWMDFKKEHSELTTSKVLQIQEELETTGLSSIELTDGQVIVLNLILLDPPRADISWIMLSIAITANLLGIAGVIYLITKVF